MYPYPALPCLYTTLPVHYRTPPYTTVHQMQHVREGGRRGRCLGVSTPGRTARVPSGSTVAQVPDSPEVNTTLPCPALPWATLPSVLPVLGRLPGLPEEERLPLRDAPAITRELDTAFGYHACRGSLLLAP